jgi:hypothetical protein
MDDLQADLERAKALLAETIERYGENPEGEFAQMILQTCRKNVEMREADLTWDFDKTLIGRLKASNRAL